MTCVLFREPATELAALSDGGPIGLYMEPMLKRDEKESRVVLSPSVADFVLEPFADRPEEPSAGEELLSAVSSFVSIALSKFSTPSVVVDIGWAADDSFLFGGGPIVPTAGIDTFPPLPTVVSMTPASTALPFLEASVSTGESRE